MFKHLSKIIFVCVALACGATLAMAVQNPTTVNNATNTAGYYAPQHLDALGNLMTTEAGPSTALNVSGATQAIKVGSGRLVSINVISASGVGAIYDTAASGTAATSNEIGIIPATQGTYQYNFPFANGLVINPASSAISVNYQ